jgi:fatty acid desaturase
MATSAKSPGPAAERAFRTGIRAAAVGALAVLGALYWTGALAGYVAVFVVIVLFPVYLLVVASVLSKWLGFAKGPTNLRRVTREDADGPRSGEGPW